MRPISFLLALILFTGIGFQSCLPDPCEGNFCDHEGTCLNGSCNCPVNYTGAHCSEQVTPFKMKVMSVTITKFPGTNEGAPWDPADGPDLFFKMSEEVHPLAQPEYLVDNANASIAYNFIIVPFDLRYVTSPYKMELFDYDGVGILPQKMGELFFTLYASNNGFPSTLILDDGGPIAFKMEVQYFFPEETD